MANTTRKIIRAHGVQVLLSRHPEIRKLKRLNAPCFHGNKLWSSSWLLMDYWKRRGLMKGARVMEAGCGWGLTGIYCAKKQGARVTCVDIDPEVFPYLHLHADINKVKSAAMKKGFAGLRGKHLEDVDVLIGSDICFWDTMVDPLRRFIRRALRSGVQLVLIADPGRPTFEKIGEYFVKKEGAEIFDWTTQRPRRIEGRILKISSNGK